MPSQYHLRQSFCFFWCKCSTVTVSLCKGLERLPHPWKMDQPWVFCLQCYYVDFSDFSIDCLYGLGNFGFKASTCFEPPGIHSQRKARWNPREVANLQLAFFTRWVEWEKSSSPKKTIFLYFDLHLLGVWSLQVLVFKCIKQWNWWNSTMSLVVYQLLETVFSWVLCILDGCIARFQLSEVFYEFSSEYWSIPWSRSWFQIFFIFTNIWGRFPIWLIFFRWVGSTTN